MEGCNLMKMKSILRSENQMDHLSPKSLVQDQSAEEASNTSSLSLILTAWLGTLLLSRLPQIVLSELGVIAPSDWSLWWWILIGAALFAFPYVWQPIRRLRGYFLILTMIYVVTIVRLFLEQTSFWISLFGAEKPWLVGFFGERLGLVLMALSLAGILILLGYRRRDFFLAFGNVNASASGMRLPWTIAAPLIGVLLAALTTAAVLAMNFFAGVTLAGVVPLLPVILILALMNAFGEEVVFRAAPLSQLWQIVGKRQAVWMTALWFGLGHYYGGISFGAVGAVFITFQAVLFGKAMLETGGLAVPVFMHLLIDVVLYVILVPGQS
jgi:membrane protease YdiL (CAAX protease family)